eukprot:scaffold47535_cov56-Phaeocystis_antarctica.AAC.2
MGQAVDRGQRLPVAVAQRLPVRPHRLLARLQLLSQFPCLAASASASSRWPTLRKLETRLLAARRVSSSSMP